MQPDTPNPSPKDSPIASAGPLASAPSESVAPPALAANVPPTLPPSAKTSKANQALVVLLSLCLGLFLANSLVSVVQALLFLFFGVQSLPGAWIVFVPSLFMAALVYVLMGFTPAIPKRLFFPVALFSPVVLVALIPVLILRFDLLGQAALALACIQLLVGVVVLFLAQGGMKLRWPLVPSECLGRRGFSWINLGAFLLANICVVLPAILVYSFLCATLAVDHYSGGFLKLRPAGLTVQAREYVRNDGKTIELVPMAHIGQAGFYQQINDSFPSNSIILMEGVTDERNLLTNNLSYKRTAKSVGLASQEEEFNPVQGRMIQADIDIDEFGSNTIALLNMAMLIHSKGINAETVKEYMQYSPPDGVVKEVFNDVLRKRNRHLIKEIHTWLPRSEHIIVPWGVAHMPEIAEEIQKSGFRLGSAKDYAVVRFGKR